MNKISTPINWPKTIDIIDFKYLAISKITSTIRLINKIKQLCAKAKYWENCIVCLKNFLNILIVHIYRNIHAVWKKFIYLKFPFLKIFTVWGKLFYNSFKFVLELFIKNSEVLIVILFVVQLNILYFFILQILYTVANPSQIMHSCSQRSLLKLPRLVRKGNFFRCRHFFLDRSFVFERYALTYYKYIFI